MKKTGGKMEPKLKKFINMNMVKYIDNNSIKLRYNFFGSIKDRPLFISLENNEPNLYLINDEKEYLGILKSFGFRKSLGKRAIVNNLRFITSVFGNYFTFNKRIFPKGINFNLVFLKQDSFYIATHRSNIVSNKRACKYQQIERGCCACVVSEHRTELKLLDSFKKIKGEPNQN